MKINANDQLDLKGFCLSGCDNHSNIYTYELYAFNTSSNQWILFENQNYYYYTGLSPQVDLTIKEELFQDYLNQSIWKVSLKVFVPSQNTSGYASILFLVNYPPRNGSCNINPKNGTTNTFFTISCFNWFDLDGNLDYLAYYGNIAINN